EPRSIRRGAAWSSLPPLVVERRRRLQADGLHDSIRFQTGLFECLRDLLDGVGFDQVQTGLVARNQDRAQVANAVSFAETGEDGRVRVCVDAVELDQVFRHPSQARTRGFRAKARKSVVFALRAGAQAA